MKASILAVGNAGARIAEALLLSAFSGALVQEDVLHVTLLWAKPEETARLEKLFSAYADLRGPWGLEPHHGMHPILTLRTAHQSPSLATLAAGAEDRALLQALLSPQEINRPASETSPRGAEIAWRILAGQLSGALADALGEAAETDTLLCLSAAEPCGAGALIPLAEAVQARGCPRLGAVILAGLETSEDTGAAPSVLRRLPALPYTALIGLPADCRSAGDGAHLLHLLAARAASAWLGGASGQHAFALPLGRFDWRVFDPSGNRWALSCDRLLQAGALWRCFYAPDLRRAIENPNPVRDRLNPWLNAYLRKARLSPEEQDRCLRHMESAAAILRDGCRFLMNLQASLPHLLRSSPALAAASRQAEAHYAEVLRLAGQLALAEHDIRESGLDEISTVHRGAMEDTEEEAALLDAAQLREDLDSALAEQRTLNQRLGSRLPLAMLERFRETTSREYSDLLAQTQEADRLIREAASRAAPADLPRVDQARARLRRMQRRLARLAGRDARVAEDIDACRALPPASPPCLETDEEDFSPLWPAAWMSAMDAFDRAEGKVRTKMAQQLLATWPWAGSSPRRIQDAVLRAVTAAHVSPALRLLDALLSVCGEN